MKSFIYNINNINYVIHITVRSSNRNIVYRFKNGEFFVSCPTRTTYESIKKGLDKFATSLIEKDKKIHPIKPFGDDFVYVLGQKVKVFIPGSVNFEGKSYKFTNMDEYMHFLYGWFLDFISKEHRKIELEMGIKPYRVKLKRMTTRYGSNSIKTRSIQYSTVLMHFDLDIIKSVIYHELCHDKVRNHQDEFYNLLLKYYPKYFYYDQLLREGRFHS